MIYVHSGPDSICALPPHHPDGLLWPMTTLGFERAGLTCFAINFSLPLAISRTGFIYQLFLRFTEADAKMNVFFTFIVALAIYIV